MALTSLQAGKKVAMVVQVSEGVRLPTEAVG